MKKIFKPAFLIVISFLIMHSLYGQVHKDMTEYLKQKFLKYCDAVPREEVYLHSDREEYIAGEELWFSAYAIDRRTLKPSLNSRIVYFELLNSENRPVVQKRILIDKGFGPGQIVLPDTLSTGTYTIRAYTNWMKNFLPDNCFMKEISIYNTLNASIFQVKKPVSKRSKNLETDSVVSGVTLKVNNSGNDSLEIMVNADNKFRNVNNQVFLFIQTRGHIDHVSSEKLTASTTKINIPKSYLSSGINQITLFNSKGEAVSEKYTYTPQVGTILFTMQSVDSIGLRDKINLDFDAAINDTTHFHLTNLSISVSPLIPKIETINLVDYMIFGSEFGNFNTLNDRKQISDLKEGVSDDILSTVSSNWIDWKQVLSDDKPEFRYKPENEDHILHGRLLTDNQQVVSTPEYLIMCSPGKDAGFQYARTDSDGNFKFSIHIDEALKDLIIMPDDVEKRQRIIIESSFSDKYLPYGIARDTSRELIPEYFSKLSVNNQVQKIYGIPSAGDPSKPAFQPEAPLRFYGKPDLEVILADFISLPVMSEVFFELIPSAALKKKKSGYEISITDRVDNTQYTTYPSLMIDGVVIKDATYIANLDPQFVEKIDVIPGNYQVGKYSFPGLINVITKAADFNSISLPAYMIRMPYRVTEPVKSFTSPDYSSEQLRESRIPDYRNTLYWNPTVKVDKTGKTSVGFWTSDNKADYIISVQGITKEGNLISISKVIRVK